MLQVIKESMEDNLFGVNFNIMKTSNNLLKESNQTLFHLVHLHTTTNLSTKTLH